MTPFRKSQAKHVLEGVIRWLAPTMQQSPSALREALTELAMDEQLWAEVADARPVPEDNTESAPIAVTSNEPP